MKRRPLPARRHLRGLTLIELMVALAIFAVLGVLSYRALAEAAHSSTRISESFERWRIIGRVMQRIDSDLIQAVAPSDTSNQTSSGSGANEGSSTGQSIVNTTNAPAMQSLQGGDNQQELRFLRIDSERGVRRVGFRLENGQLQWLRWDDREGSQNPRITPLMDGVSGLRWRFMYSKNLSTSWPLSSERRNLLPDAVILELDLDGVGTLTRTVALR
jgi:general secretion pathway protein J